MTLAFSLFLACGAEALEVGPHKNVLPVRAKSDKLAVTPAPSAPSAPAQHGPVEPPLGKEGNTTAVLPDGRITFGRGPVVCTTTDKTVLKATVPECSYWTGRLQSGGICVVRLATTAGVREYGVVARLDLKEVRELPDTPLESFNYSYDGITCTLAEERISRVEQCKEYEGGAIKQCTLCLKGTENELCYYAHLSIAKQVPLPRILGKGQ